MWKTLIVFCSQSLRRRKQNPYEPHKEVKSKPEMWFSEPSLLPFPWSLKAPVVLSTAPEVLPSKEGPSGNSWKLGRASRFTDNAMYFERLLTRHRILLQPIKHFDHTRPWLLRFKLRSQLTHVHFQVRLPFDTTFNQCQRDIKSVQPRASTTLC